MAACGNCGRHVSAGYHRVFAAEEGGLSGCPYCGGGRVGRGA